MTRQNTTNTWRNLDFFQRSSDHQIGIDRISEYPTFSRDRIPPIIIWGPHFAVERGIRSWRTWRKPSTFRPITWRSPSPCRPTWCRRAWKRWKSTRKRLERATVPWNRFWRSGKGWTGLQRLKERLKERLKKRSVQSACNVRCRCCVAHINRSFQDAVLKANASKHLNSAVDVKENLTSLLYERVWMLRDSSDHLRSSDHETVTSCYM